MLFAFRPLHLSYLDGSLGTVGDDCYPNEEDHPQLQRDYPYF